MKSLKQTTLKQVTKIGKKLKAFNVRTQAAHVLDIKKLYTQKKILNIIVTRYSFFQNLLEMFQLIQRENKMRLNISSMLTKEEQEVFQQLYNKWNWKGNWRNKLPELKNPNNLNYCIEFKEIDSYLISLVKRKEHHKVWRGYGWFDTMQRWFEKTHRYNLIDEALLNPIDVPEHLIEESSSLKRKKLYMKSQTILILFSMNHGIHTLNICTKIFL